MDYKCRTIDLNFELAYDPSDRDIHDFDEYTEPIVANLLRECLQNGQRTNELVIHPGANNKDGFLPYFFVHAQTTRYMSALLKNVDALVFPRLRLDRSSFPEVQKLLAKHPHLKIIVHELMMHGDPAEDSLTSDDHKNRLFIRRLVRTHGLRTITLSDANAISNHPVDELLFRHMNMGMQEFVQVQRLLASYPCLKIIVRNVTLNLGRDERDDGVESMSRDHRDRLFLGHVSCEAGTTPADAHAMTTNPIESIEVLPEEVEEMEEMEDEPHFFEDDFF
jgi:hypothetical protein